MTRHLLDLPAAADNVHLLCGPKLNKRYNVRGDYVSGDPAISNCIGCLRAKTVMQAHVITRLTEEVARLEEALAKAKAGE